MKKIYNLNESELKKENLEFKSTAYGKRLYNCLFSVIITSIIIFAVYIFSSFFGETAGVETIIKDGFSWLIMFLFSAAEEFMRFKYNNALKEYIESKNE